MTAQKIFLALPMTGLMDSQTGLITDSYRQWIESVLGYLRTQGHEVKCVLEEEAWGAETLPPDEAFKKDQYYAGQWCDTFMFYIGEPTSTSGLVEAGFALAGNKNIVLLHSSDFKFPPDLENVRFAGKYWAPAFGEIQVSKLHGAEKNPVLWRISQLLSGFKPAFSAPGAGL